jgi:hypothetical protein
MKALGSRRFTLNAAASLGSARPYRKSASPRGVETLYTIRMPKLSPGWSIGSASWVLKFAMPLTERTTASLIRFRDSATVSSSRFSAQLYAPRPKRPDHCGNDLLAALYVAAEGLSHAGNTGDSESLRCILFRWRFAWHCDRHRPDWLRVPAPPALELLALADWSSAGIWQAGPTRHVSLEFQKTQYVIQPRARLSAAIELSHISIGSINLRTACLHCCARLPN